MIFNRTQIKKRQKAGSRTAGFTLIETLIAISLLMMAVVEPMVLTSQALKSAYYARDQITASNLAQEGIEAVRAERDKRILTAALTGTNVDIFGSIPVDQDFTIDARKDSSTDPSAMTPCAGPCPRLQTDGNIYGYQSGWTNTAFTRTLRAQYVPGTTDEMRLTVTVTWRTGSYPARTITLNENLFRWVSNN